MNNQVGNLLQTFLNLADSHSLSIDQSFEHLLDSSPCDADQSLLIDRALKLGSLLLEAGNRSARKRSSFHNSLTWALPPDLTIKVSFLLLSFFFPRRFLFRF
jgi:F-box/leucine-rich repeat protein 2/20